MWTLSDAGVLLRLIVFSSQYSSATPLPGPMNWKNFLPHLRQKILPGPVRSVADFTVLQLLFFIISPSDDYLTADGVHPLFQGVDALGGFFAGGDFIIVKHVFFAYG